MNREPDDSNTKAEAAEILGSPKKTVERDVKQNRIQKVLRRNPGPNFMPEFHPGDSEARRAEPVQMATFSGGGFLPPPFLPQPATQREFSGGNALGGGPAAFDPDPERLQETGTTSCGRRPSTSADPREGAPTCSVRPPRRRPGRLRHGAAGDRRFRPVSEVLWAGLDGDRRSDPIPGPRKNGRLAPRGRFDLVFVARQPNIQTQTPISAPGTLCLPEAG